MPLLSMLLLRVTRYARRYAAVDGRRASDIDLLR